MALGPRTQQTAHTLVHTVRVVLAPGCIPVITTDGPRLYFDAITAYVSRWVSIDGRRRQPKYALLSGSRRPFAGQRGARELSPASDRSTPLWCDYNLAFPRERGTAIHPDNLTHYFREMAEKAGMPVLSLDFARR